MRPPVLISIVVILLVIAAGVWIIATQNRTNNNTTNSTTPQTTSSETKQPESTPSTATEGKAVKYTASGFDPSTITVKSGSSLTFTNNSSEAIQVDSDPHPAHTSNPELNVGRIESGKSATVTLKQTGSFGVHNHLDPSMKMTVVIE